MLPTSLRQFLKFLPLLWLPMACQPDRSRSTTAPDAATTQPQTQELRDDLGRQLTVAAQPRRIMALAPSATEMLYAIADTATIIARTQNCDYPAAALRKPIVSSYPLDMEKLVALHPDIVFTVEGITSLDDAARLATFGIPVYYQRFQTLPDVFRGMRDLGRILHRQPQARHLTDSLQAELTAVAQSTPATQQRPRVLAITWQDPIYVYGQNTLFTDKLKIAGGQNAVTEKFAQPYPALTREYILKLNPDVLIGGSFGKLDSTFFKNYPELKRINAYKTRRVYGITGNLMERPSPRVVESVRELQRIVTSR
ncbi:ABC transporter substrate-binding protein [Hymenobacter volaticus]|uniref:Helical backbone metal receptor n=1 Tax=Hymenobacter volaticus TaxID=2932254 RepID=A0ABY4G2M0_9BACT|nr:helical backbone metal receptor [Hymenobacter volaticus]UOQ65098.1 helical backbone metal receptor [Hymenobacter volaticus]